MYLAFFNNSIARPYCNINCPMWSGKNCTARIYVGFIIYSLIEHFCQMTTYSDRLWLPPEHLFLSECLFSHSRLASEKSPERRAPSSEFTCHHCCIRFISSASSPKDRLFLWHQSPCTVQKPRRHFLKYSKNATHDRDRVLPRTNCWAPIRRCGSLFQIKDRLEEQPSGNPQNTFLLRKTLLHTQEERSSPQTQGASQG